MVGIGSGNKMRHYKDDVRSIERVIPEIKSKIFQEHLVTNFLILWEPGISSLILEPGTVVLSVL
jgi:hypothetical protein